MIFLLPLGLLALLTLPIIVLLHLLRERRRRVAVPSLMHWLNLPHQPEGQRIRRLPLTLLLLLHLLAAVLIGLALGRPQVFGEPAGEARQVAIVVDTSTSMAARQASSTRFAQAQQRARATLRGLGRADRVTLIAAGPAARIVAESNVGDATGLLAAIDQLRPGGTGFDLDGALTLAEASFEQNLRRRIVVITDAANPAPPASSQNAAPLRALAAALDWQMVGDDAPNRAIVAFAARPWGGSVQVYARAANYDSAPLRTIVRLYGDDQLLDTRDMTIAADGEIELTWTLPKGHTRLRAALEGQDALAEDDDGILTVELARDVRALLVSARPDALRRALEAVPGVSVAVAGPATYSGAAGTVDLTVFDSVLPAAWPSGATLAINPPDDATLLRVTPPARRASDGDRVQAGALLAGLGFGGVRFGPIQAVTPPAWAETQLAIGGAPLILRGRDSTHEIAIWTFDLASSNLPARLAFPLLVARTVRDLTPPPLPSSVQAGAPLTVRPDPRAAAVRVSAPDGSSATIAAAPSLTLDMLTRPGLYQIEEQRDGATVFRGQVPVNAGAAIESDLRARPAPPLAGSDGGGGAPHREMNDIWPWLALGTLAVLMLEWGYIHR